MSAAFQYNVAAPDSLQMRVATRQRRVMYERFVKALGVDAQTTILDVGVTSDRTIDNSNYLEAWHPHLERIVALGIEDASFLEKDHPGVRFVQGDGLALPFADRSFDVVHSSAVIEHVGSFDNQARLVAECARVARHGVFVTTPNRWFPIEVHTSLPLIHWLPKARHRALLDAIGHGFLAREENLNLMDARDFEVIAARLAGFTCEIDTASLAGLPSNLMFVARRLPG